MAPVPADPWPHPPLAQPSFAQRTRTRRRAFVLAGMLVLAVAALASAPDPDATDEPARRVSSAALRGPERATPLPPGTGPFARWEDLTLHLPSPRPVLVAYHEASLEAALALTPVGTAAGNANTTKVTPPDDDPGGPDYVVMSSRGRVNAGTSAVDVVMRDDDPVLAPVSGTVTDVQAYALYGAHDDRRIELRPDGAAHLRIVLIHVRDVVVAPGDRVAAGRTVLAEGARRFPFSSHVDRYTHPARWPHVHLEVKHV